MDSMFLWLAFASALLTRVCISATSNRQYHHRNDVMFSLVRDPLSGSSCDDFVKINNEWNGGATGRVQFNVPIAAQNWNVEVIKLSFLYWRFLSVY